MEEEEDREKPTKDEKPPNVNQGLSDKQFI